VRCNSSMVLTRSQPGRDNQFMCIYISYYVCCVCVYIVHLSWCFKFICFIIL
jgi:hypothetical protein